jgi:hypothetical protein
MESEMEFSMLDQADFPGIDAYVKRHGLNDASLADTRRAKVYNVNAPRGTQEAEAGANNVTDSQDQNGTLAAGHVSELQKAEQILQDEEDEDDEDYDEDYDGEGSSEDEGYGEGEEGEDGEGGSDEEEYDEEEEEEEVEYEGAADDVE